MIKVFKASDTDFTTNGEKILNPDEAIITSNIEEEYLELEAPLKYKDYLVQDNILIVDTLTGKKGYRIFNPVVNITISIKAWLCYRENNQVSADRGVVISHGKNLANCEVTETWDDVVTKLIPVGYNGTRLPEGYLSVIHSYQRGYEKTIEFELSETLEDEVKLLEEDIETNTTLEATLKNSVEILTAKYNAYDGTIASLQSEKTTLQTRLSQLGTSDAELKEKAVIEAQIPLIDDNITAMTTDKATTLAVRDSTQTDLIQATADLATAKASYNTKVITDLRTQAQAYINTNQYPQINYNLEAHLEGIVELGDTVKVKHLAMRVDLLTNVTAYKYDCLTNRFRQVEFGTSVQGLKGKFTEVENKIVAVKETVDKAGRSITKYASEYRKDDKELFSKFISELYGSSGGIYEMIEKNNSTFRQTASEISGTVERVNTDLSKDITSLSLKADGISATVTNNNNTLSQNIASLDLTADQIQLTVSAIDRDLTTAESTITQQANLISLRVEKGKIISEINQTAESIKISASKLNLFGYATFASLETPGTVEIDGGNLKANSIVAESIKAGGTITGAKFTNGAVTIDDSDITITAISGKIYGKTGTITREIIGFTGNQIFIGEENYAASSYLYMKQQYINIGYTGSEIKMGVSKIGFFSASPVQRQIVDKVYTASVTLPFLAIRFNELLTAMNTNGLINANSSS